MESSEEARRRIVHEMRNRLAVAVANLEAWHEGKLEATPHRIGVVLSAVSSLDALIDELYITTKTAERRNDGETAAANTPVRPVP